MRQTHQINQLDKTNKANKSHRTTLGIIATLVLSTIVGIGIYSGISIANTNTTNALSYSTNEDISFTFAPTLSIGLSTDSLTIDNLVPGNTSDSNKVSVTVSSNTPYGYVLSAGVGSTVSTDPYYNTSDLVHDNSTTQVPTTNKFSSIATSASLQTLDTDNTWGYSTSTDGGTSWSAYSGLSHAATKPLLDISDPATPSTIDFKIAARSATTQASGTYNNVITFYAVGKPEPVYYMQDTATIKAELQNVGDELQAIDIRDDKKYWIRKMADGEIWMTQNLDLELDSAKTYTPADTDISTNWQPAQSTIEFTDTSISGWSNSNYIPYSASPGELYVYTSGTTTIDSKYSSLASCQAAHPDCSAHNHAGNYYNWSAAVANNYSSKIKTKYEDAPNSICPAGWRLPKVTGKNNITTGSVLGSMLAAEGIITESIGASYTANGFDNIRISPLWLLRFGYVHGNSLKKIGLEGYYRSSTVYSDNDAYILYIQPGYADPANDSNGRYNGYPIRCLVK